MFLTFSQSIRICFFDQSTLTIRIIFKVLLLGNMCVRARGGSTLVFGTFWTDSGISSTAHCATQKTRGSASILGVFWADPGHLSMTHHAAQKTHAFWAARWTAKIYLENSSTGMDPNSMCVCIFQPIVHRNLLSFN